MKYCQVILSFMAKCFAFVHHQSCLTSHPVRLRSSGASYISGGSCYLYFIQFLDYPQMKELRRSGLICVGHLIEPTVRNLSIDSYNYDQRRRYFSHYHGQMCRCRVLSCQRTRPNLAQWSSWYLSTGL